MTKRAREQSHANLYKLIEELNNRVVKELSVMGYVYLLVFCFKFFPIF